jgi:hypothetical protein
MLTPQLLQDALFLRVVAAPPCAGRCWHGPPLLARRRCRRSASFSLLLRPARSTRLQPATGLGAAVFRRLERLLSAAGRDVEEQHGHGPFQQSQQPPAARPLGGHDDRLRGGRAHQVNTAVSARARGSCDEATQPPGCARRTASKTHDTVARGVVFIGGVCAQRLLWIY